MKASAALSLYYDKVIMRYNDKLYTYNYALSSTYLLFILLIYR